MKTGRYLLIYIMCIILCVSGFSLMVSAEGVIQENETSLRMRSIIDSLADFNDEDIESTLAKFSDIGINWAAGYIARLTHTGIINGYTVNDNGSVKWVFSQKDSINVDAFIKMAVKSIGYNPENGSGYWAQTFIDIALEEGLIDENEFSDYKRPILREEAAKIIVRAFLLREQAPAPNLVNKILEEIPDYYAVADKYKNDVLQSYAIGLITGMPDKSFKPKDEISREQAAAVIMRFIQPELRIPFVPESLKDAKTITLPDLLGNEVKVYPMEGLEEVIDAAYALDDARKLTKGASCIHYFSHIPSISTSYFSNEEDMNSYWNYQTPEDIQKIHMDIDIYTDNQREFQYIIDIWRIGQTKELHMDVLSEMFKYWFENEYEHAWGDFQSYMTQAGNGDINTIWFDYNGIKGRFVLNGGITVQIQAKK